MNHSSSLGTSVTGSMKVRLRLRLSGSISKEGDEEEEDADEVEPLGEKGLKRKVRSPAEGGTGGDGKDRGGGGGRVMAEGVD